MEKNPEYGYNGNFLIKRDGIVHNYSKEEVDEYLKCTNDPIYFTREYCKIIDTDVGITDFDLYDYQERMFRQFEQERFNIVLAARQSGKSAAMCAYTLHFALFKPEKDVFILANKAATAREMLGRITLMLEHIPYFLQPGCKAVNKGSLHFSNNSRIIAAATSSSSIRGMSASLIVLDEYGFVNNAEEFYASTYPVISKGKNSKIIIISTPNGIGNQFHKLWEGAVQGTNEFKPIKVNWWDVPGRDEKWKQETIANSSETQFRQEFGLDFIGRGNTLIDSNKLLSLVSEKPIINDKNVRIYEKAEEEDAYIITVDVSKGRGQDYSTFSIIKITSTPFKVVAVYQDNMISPLLFPDIIHKYAKMYNDAYIIVENNDQGAVVANALYYDIEYENVYVESSIKRNSIGVMMTKRVKRIGCSNLKDLIEEDKLYIPDGETINEISSFEAHGNSYSASPGSHDDLVMNLVLFAWFVSTNFFSDMTNINFKQLLYKEKLQSIEDDLTPVGIFNSDSFETTEKEDTSWLKK